METLHPVVNSKEILSHDDNETMTRRPLDNVDTDGGFGNKFGVLTFHWGITDNDFHKGERKF